MTTAQREAEATEASVAFQAALATVGVATIEQALQLWDAVPATAQAAQAGAWLSKATTMVMTRRTVSRALAMAYYRLARALRTGRTIADPARPVPPYVTLEDLRREFAALAGPRTAPAAGAPDQSYTPGTEGNDERIPVEKLDSLATDHARLEREAEAQAREVLDQLGALNLERKTAKLDTAQPAEDVDAAREQAHREAGTRQAAAAERLVMDGARGALWANAARDKRVVGYARASRTGTPCGWCAMLISRGAVYKTAASASYSDGDKYHDNCHCYAEPLFTEAQYVDKRFDINREYAELWPVVTKGKSGKDAVAVWRRYFRQQQKASALAARSTPNALEASTK